MNQNKTILKGIGVSVGVIKGKVRIVGGVKDATKVLKDGDLVEVDGEKGIIQKLE